MINRTSGLAFPLILSSGRHTIVSGVDLIQASIKTILTWPLYTRIFMGSFGSRLHEALEDPNDNVLITIIRRFVIDSLSFWEQRIELLDMTIERPTPEKLVIDLIYKVRDLNVQDNFRYTYYIN